jgi:hypothetical protein
MEDNERSAPKAGNIKPQIKIECPQKIVKNPLLLNPVSVFKFLNLVGLLTPLKCDQYLISTGCRY